MRQYLKRFGGKGIMGEKLIRIFEIVSEQAGLKGRMELATRTGISLNRATQMKDTDELVKRMKEMASSILDKNSQIS
jgi:hypothetical protein